MIARVAITLAFGLVCLSPTLFLDPAGFNMADGPQNYMTGVVILVIVPFFAGSFGLFAFSRYAFNRLKLDNPDSYGKEFQLRADLYHEMGFDANGDIELRQA